MGFILWLVMGLLVGMAAGFLMKSNYPWYIDVLLGIVGSMVGGWLTGLILGVDLTGGFNLTTFIVSLIGAVIVIAIYRLVTRQSVTRR
jgi:uncharacterized membrane protein YeaQ/YmgE (transglycosylase-associated protein family)